MDAWSSQSYVANITNIILTNHGREINIQKEVNLVYVFEIKQKEMNK